MSVAHAADLGGDCCADLEERVATLEATTVRKGNNKVSVKLSGQVNRAVVYWNDGKDSDTYAGVDNSQTSSRWRFEGDAKISATMKAGFIMEWEVSDNTPAGSGTSGMGASSKLGGKNQSAHFAQINGGGSDGYIEQRLAAWWLESSQLGRVTVGRFGMAGSAFGAVDFGNVNVISNIGGESQMPPGTFNWRNGLGQYSSANWSAIGVVTLMGTRGMMVRYDTPSIAGFGAAANWGDDDTWSAEAKWAGKIGSFGIAAIVGYQNFTSELAPPEVGLTNRRDQRRFSVGGGIQHDPTGLFVQGGYLLDQFGNDVAGTANGRTAFTDGSKQPDRTQWAVQGGISQNWFGVGKTTLYGEYGQNSDFGVGTQFGFSALGAASTAFTISSAETQYWGLGLVQSVDAAAMDLYVGYKHFSADVTACASGAATTAANCAANAGAVDIKDFDVIIGGARIKF